jgi:SAM-dependent methyltransferase
MYWQCSVCQLVHLDPVHHLDPSDEKARYDLHENDPEDEGYRRFLRRLLKPLTPRLEQGARGLDYGAGPAPVLADMLAVRGYSMSTYDPFFTSEGGALTGSYDFITCTETAEHFHHPAREFRRFDRLIRPGGWIGIMTRKLECLEDLDVGFEQWHYRRDETHVCFYSRPAMEWIADRFGWQTEYVGWDVTLYYCP